MNERPNHHSTGLTEKRGQPVNSDVELIPPSFQIAITVNQHRVV